MSKFEFKKKFKLPFLKLEVVMSMPEYGLSEKVRNEAKVLEVENDPNIVSEMMISKFTTIDGKVIVREDLARLPFKDFEKIVTEWDKWTDPEKDTEKSPLGGTKNG